MSSQYHVTGASVKTPAQKTANTVKPAVNANAQAMDPVADLLGSARVVAFKADFAHLTGSVTAALLLSQFWYWTGVPTSQQRDGWFYITMDEISEQTGMVREEQETARKRLRDLGILEERRQGVPAKLWFRLNKERLYELLRSYAAKKEAALQSASQDAGLSHTGDNASQKAGIPQTVVRELRRLARGIVTGKSAPVPQSITIDVSLDSSIEFLRASDPPINPPKGEDAGAGKTPAIGEGSEWGEALSRMRGKIGAMTYNCCLKRLQWVEDSDNGVRLRAPDTATKHQAEKEAVLGVLVSTLSEIRGTAVSVSFV